MEQNKETECQDILEKLGFNDPSQVKILETCRVLKHTKIRLFVRRLLMEVRNPDLFRINKLIDAAFRNELGAIDRNVPIWEVLRPQIPYKTKIEQPPKRIFVNTTDEAKLFPMIYDYCKEELEKVRTAEWMREKALKYLSLYYEEWKKGQQVAPEPPQGAPEPPQGAPEIPTINNTDKERLVFGNALQKQCMTLVDGHYKWNLTKSLLAYMCGKLYCGDKIKEDDSDYSRKYIKGNTQMPAQEVKSLFGVDVASNRYSIKEPPRNSWKVDELFKSNGASK